MKAFFSILLLCITLPAPAQNITYVGGDGDGGGNAFYSGAIALPLTLVAFTAEPTEDRVSLRWTTRDEQNTESFTVERSRDGITFLALTRLAAAGDGRGLTLDYRYEDNSPVVGRSFYRLLATDFDGSVTRSDVYSVNWQAAEPVLILYPNPTHGVKPHVRLIQKNASESFTLIVYDLQGREVFHGYLSPAGREQSTQPLPALPPGSYRVRVMSSGRSLTQTLLVSESP
jgi:hypothetical protein